MSSAYYAELRDLDRSHLLHVATVTSPITGQVVTQALYRQPNGFAKLHVLNPWEDEGSFVDVLDRDEEISFWLAELDAWKPAGRAC